MGVTPLEPWQMPPNPPILRVARLALSVLVSLLIRSPSRVSFLILGVTRQDSLRSGFGGPPRHALRPGSALNAAGAAGVCSASVASGAVGAALASATPIATLTRPPGASVPYGGASASTPTTC